MKTVYKRFDLPVITSEGQEEKKAFELDNNSIRLVGVAMTANNDNLLFNRGTVGIELNGHEITPDEFHAKLLMSGLSVPPDKRFLSTSLETGNQTLKVTYKDNPHPTVAHSNYVPYLYCLVEIDH